MTPPVRAALALSALLVAIAAFPAVAQASPIIGSVSFSGSQDGSTNPTVTITGIGFDPQPAATPAVCGGSLFPDNQLSFYTSSALGGAFSAGSESNLLGLALATYTDTTIVYQLGSGGCGYPTFGKVVQGGTFTVDVNGASCTGIVNYTSPVPCSPLDITAPTVTITSGPSDPTSSTSAEFDFSASDPDDSSGFVFSCNLDDGAFSACGDGTGGASTSASYSGLADGTHTFAVHAADAAGNAGSDATYTWRVDTLPPVLSLPADMVVNATSPAGATVAFTATSQDDDGSFYPVTCSPASGATFPIGTTAVSCQATDAAGNTASGGFAVTVKGAEDQLVDLLVKVDGLVPGRSLTGKLESALDRLRAGDRAGACDSLDHFMSAVRVRSGKSITVATADALLADAARIQAVIRCA